jgi:hypothetical protein
LEAAAFVVVFDDCTACCWTVTVILMLSLLLLRLRLQLVLLWFLGGVKT